MGTVPCTRAWSAARPNLDSQGLTAVTALEPAMDSTAPVLSLFVLVNAQCKSPCPLLTPASGFLVQLV